MRNYNYYSAPPLVGGYGGYGYGGGGISIMPSFGMPLFYGGGIFNFFIVMVCSSQLSLMSYDVACTIRGAICYKGKQHCPLLEQQAEADADLVHSSVPAVCVLWMLWCKLL